MQRASDIPSTLRRGAASPTTTTAISTNGTPNQCAINARVRRARPRRPGGHPRPHAAGARRLHDLDDRAPARERVGVPGRRRSPRPSSTGSCAAAPAATLDLVAARRPRTARASRRSRRQRRPVQGHRRAVRWRVADATRATRPTRCTSSTSGDVTTLWCADFEAGAADWTHGATPANRDEWEAGAPMGIGGDPEGRARRHERVRHRPLATTACIARAPMTWAESPEIDLQGNTAVRLQYCRWLGVEDGFYDSARDHAPTATKVWSNFASAADPMSGDMNHVDKEWRFQDVDLSAQAASGKVKLRSSSTATRACQLRRLDPRRRVRRDRGPPGRDLRQRDGRPGRARATTATPPTAMAARRRASTRRQR